MIIRHPRNNSQLFVSFGFGSISERESSKRREKTGKKRKAKGKQRKAREIKEKVRSTTTLGLHCG